MRTARPPYRPRQLHPPVVQRQHPVASRFNPPEIDQRPQTLWFLRRQIAALREILIEVIQLPFVVLEIGPCAMPRHRLPAVLPDPAVADHLEILRPLPGRSLRLVQRIGEARPAHRQLAAPAVALRRFRAQRLQHRRQHIRHVVKLMPHPAPLRNPLRPMHDQRHPHPAAVRVLLVPLQRRVARLRPAPRIVGRGARTANLVQPPLRLREILRQRLKQPRRVRKALRAALLRRPVIGRQNDQRV